jgi:putative ABC transport system permease protein
MSRLVSRMRSLWRSLRTRQRLDAEMDDEFRFHVEQRAADLERTGLSAGEAARIARMEFGGTARYREEGREARGLSFFDQLRGDLRYAQRSLRRDPVFTLVAVMTLALGIGANTAIFSVIHHTLLEPLPYDAPDRIVTLRERDGSEDNGTVADENFRDWQRGARSFDAMAYHGNPDFGGPETVLGADKGLRVWINGGTERFFDVFGARTVRGRLFTPDEHRQSGPAVAVVSHAFWQGHMGGDHAILGRTLDMLGEQYEIIGVLQPGFHYPGDTDIWVPLLRFGTNADRSAKNYVGVARLREGVTVAEAQRELDGIGTSLVTEHGEGSGAAGAVATPLREALFGSLREPLLLLLGAAALLLLIACTNLASTLLARGAMRQREVAIRSALGAGRRRIVRQLLTESILLSLLGAAAGVWLAVLLLRALEAMRPTALGAVTGGVINGPVLAFTLVLTIATALLFGLLPALRNSVTGIGTALHAGSRGNADSGRGGVWTALIGLEVALAVVLLIGAGLLIRSFVGVVGQETGFDPRHVLTVDVSLPASRYAGDQEIAAYYERALSALRGVPGVQEAGLIQHIPLGGVSLNGSFEIDGRGDGRGYASYRIASPGYYRAMGIPILRGRDFATADRWGTTPVAVINRSLAEREWPGQNPIGRRIRNLANEPPRYRDPNEWITIIGVVADVRQGGLLAQAEPEIHVNVLQRPARARNAVLTLRTSVPPASAMAAARTLLERVDPMVPVEFTTMTQRVMSSVADRRFNMSVLGLFATVALALAAVGIYGVVSYAVARRTREIGIRLALGATPSSVRRLMQRRTMMAVVIGAIAGAISAIGLSELLRGLLWGVEPGDPLTSALATIVLAAVAWLATWIPARRSTAVDPIVTMRAE